MRKSLARLRKSSARQYSSATRSRSIWNPTCLLNALDFQSFLSQTSKGYSSACCSTTTVTVGVTLLISFTSTV